MIFNSDTIATVNRKTYTSDEVTYLENVAIPAFWSFALQYTNRSWYNNETLPNGFIGSNSAIKPEKVPDDVVIALSVMVDQFLSDLNKSCENKNLKRVSVGQVVIEHFTDKEKRKEISDALDNYIVPAV